MSWKLSAAATEAIFQNLPAPHTGEIVSNLTNLLSNSICTPLLTLFMLQYDIKETVNEYLVWCFANIHKVALLVPWFENVMHVLMENFFNEFNFSQKVMFIMLFWQG